MSKEENLRAPVKEQAKKGGSYESPVKEENR
jgi:hypothetical protein